jgi:conjugal transfer pilus assembly protein TraF
MSPYTALAFTVAVACAALRAHHAFAQPGERPRTDLSICQGTASYWCDSRRGWHFYDDPAPQVSPEPPKLEPPKPEPPKPQAPQAEPHGAKPPELAEFEELQKRLEEYRHIAVIRPTEANVRRYMELEARVVRQAAHFADVARRLAWAHPELDMTLEGRPVNARAIEAFDREQAAQRASQVSALAATHVLFFFFRSDCPYCHAFAPTLHAFEAAYGLQVVPISVDGGALPPFAAYRRDNGIAAALDVTQVPAVFLAEPRTGSIAPIGFGVLSESQLLERIATVHAAPKTPPPSRLLERPSASAPPRPPAAFAASPSPPTAAPSGSSPPGSSSLGTSPLVSSASRSSTRPSPRPAAP